MKELKERLQSGMNIAYGDFYKNYPRDASALAAIASANTKSDADALKGWLASYRVFQNYKTTDREAVVQAIFGTVRTFAAIRTISNVTDLQTCYALLYNRIAAVAPKCGAGGIMLRDVTSLTSKALWCCSPQFVPIYDSFALTALSVLGRLYGIRPPSYSAGAHKRYFEFCDVWFELSNRLDARSTFNAAFTTNGWGGNAPAQDVAFTRTFDKFLWIMGERSFT